LVGFDVLHRRFGDHDAIDRLARRAFWCQVHLSRLGRRVHDRLGAVRRSAGRVPLAQATLFTIYPRERHGYAMAIFSTGAMMGPIIGPTLGGWLTDNFGWRWCFYINLPVGALCALGIFAFIRPSRPMRRDPFDGFGFAMLSLGVGSLQLM